MEADVLMLTLEKHISGAMPIPLMKHPDLQPVERYEASSRLRARLGNWTDKYLRRRIRSKMETKMGVAPGDESKGIHSQFEITKKLLFHEIVKETTFAVLSHMWLRSTEHEVTFEDTQVKDGSLRS